MKMNNHYVVRFILWIHSINYVPTSISHFNKSLLSFPFFWQSMHIATRDRDTHGALSAGMQAAYIDRSGAPCHPQYRHPDVYGTSMDDTVVQIIARDGDQ